jgi:hypothetical protein
MKSEHTLPVTFEASLSGERSNFKSFLVETKGLIGGIRQVSKMDVQTLSKFLQGRLPQCANLRIRL